jgi:putative membrane protein
MLSQSGQLAPGWLPLTNTALIVISGIFLLVGYFFIRRGQVSQHRASMLTATAFAAAFLVVYVTRALLFETKIFAGDGWVRALYLAILSTHTIIAIAVGPMALVTLYRALKGRFGDHRSIARITLPAWLFVVASGWIVYLMLHTIG